MGESPVTSQDVFSHFLQSLTSRYMRLSPGDGKKSGIRDTADVRVDGTNWFLV